MARVKLSEFKAKSLLVNKYVGAPLRIDNLANDLTKLNDTTSYVIKLDQGVKKRGKQGLLKLNITKSEAAAAVEELAKKGYERFLAEPMLPHEPDEEQYVSFERSRDGIVVRHSNKGGVDIEDNTESVQTFTTKDTPLPKSFVEHITTKMDAEHMAFVEINPLIVRGDECIPLDAAVLVDSAGEYQSSWDDNDIVEARTLTDSEAAIAMLDQNSPAALSFRVLNPDGALWMLLSGGGASITIADEAANQGKSNLIGNYGEYSGGPTTEETYLYTLEVLSQALLANTTPIAIIIAGGVANFTDVKKTFRGIIQALEEKLEGLQQKQAKVYVRRGGPNETEGLAMIEKYLREHNLFGAVHGSDMVLTEVINEALEYVHA